MKTVEDLKAMLNEVTKTAMDFQEFEKATEKILEVKLLTKMENIKKLFEKYNPVFKGLKQLRGQVYNSSFLPYMDFNVVLHTSIELFEDENGSFIPAIKISGDSYCLRFEANEKFTEGKICKITTSWSKDCKNSCTISKNTCKKCVLPIDLNQLENKIVNNLTDEINAIERELQQRKDTLMEQLNTLKDIPFVDLNNIMDLPLAYIYTIQDCLEGVRKFRLAGAIGFEEIVENDFYDQIDEVLNNLIIPLSKKGNDVKIIEEEV